MKTAIFVALLGLALAAAEDEKHAFTAPEAETQKFHRNKAPPGVEWKHKDKRQAPTCGTPTALTAAQNTETVTAHNNFRSQEASADEISMSYSAEMAAVAQAYANQCVWAHGMLYDCEGNRLGQNLFVSSLSTGFPAVNMTGAIAGWYGEKQFWNYATASCNAGPTGECGHFTQVVWDVSRMVGCGFANCPTMNVGGSTWTNCLFIVCDYTPPGNVEDANGNLLPIYKSGAACSNCDSAQTGAGYLCSGNLCQPCTPASNSACKCGTPSQACDNGGTWSTATCSCQCTSKFYGTFCDSPCSCADLQPTSCPGWKTSGYCTNPDYQVFMQQNCMTTCGFTCSLPASCSSS